jgi:predicted peptidase
MAGVWPTSDDRLLESAFSTKEKAFMRCASGVSCVAQLRFLLTAAGSFTGKLILIAMVASAIWPATAAGQLQTKADVKAARMAAYDHNSDGKIERHEVNEAAWKRLALFDKNSDGVLAGDELDRLTPARNPASARMGWAPQSFARQTFKASSGYELEFGFLTPNRIEPETRLPLVLCLHGSGGEPFTARVIGSDQMQKKYPCFVMAPLCDSSKSRWADAGAFDPLKRRRLATEVLEALEHMVATHAVDPDRIYVTGLSMGGAGTWALIISNPNRFAAAAPICGFADPDDASRIAKLPIWIFYGDQDQTVSVEASRQMATALKKAGGSPRYTEFPGVGHNSWAAAYAMDEFWDWLFSQRRGQNNGGN